MYCPCFYYVSLHNKNNCTIGNLSKFVSIRKPNNVTPQKQNLFVIWRRSTTRGRWSLLNETSIGSGVSAKLPFHFFLIEWCTSIILTNPKDYSNTWPLHRNYSFLLFQSVLKTGYFFHIAYISKIPVNFKLHTVYEKRKYRNACYSLLTYWGAGIFTLLHYALPCVSHKDNISIHMV